MRREKTSVSQEDYLKAVWEMLEENQTPIAARLAEELNVTPPAITAAYLARNHPGARCALLNSGDIAADLSGVRITDGDDPAPDVVILGGAGPEFSYPALNRVFGWLLGGARLVAMGRNLYWRTESGLQLDTGAFLAGLEQAAGVRAEVTGKPAAAFFAAYWCIFGGLPLIASPVSVAPAGMLFLAAACGAVLLGGWLAQRWRGSEASTYTAPPEPPG